VKDLAVKKKFLHSKDIHLINQIRTFMPIDLYISAPTNESNDPFIRLAKEG
jgi:hypothetical protein